MLLSINSISKQAKQLSQVFTDSFNLAAFESKREKEFHKVVMTFCPKTKHYYLHFNDNGEYYLNTYYNGKEAAKEYNIYIHKYLQP